MSNDQSTSDLVKVAFELDASDWHGCHGEKMWAKPLVARPGLISAKLENSPFYVKGVSYLDVVRARWLDGVYQFTGVVSHSGHSTYRLLVDNPDDAFRLWWGKLQDLGCTYENGGDHYDGKTLFSVDVPPPTDINAVYRILEDGEKEKVWLFEEGHVGHPLKA